MPLVARKAGSGDVVNTVHPVCISPGNISTDQGSDSVFVVGHGCHREGDLNQAHTHCPPVYGTPVTSYSSNVYANGKRVARLGDTYSCSAQISSVAQSSVFANG